MCVCVWNGSVDTITHLIVLPLPAITALYLSPSSCCVLLLFTYIISLTTLLITKLSSVRYFRTFVLSTAGIALYARVPASGIECRRVVRLWDAQPNSISTSPFTLSESSDAGSWWDQRRVHLMLCISKITKLNYCNYHLALPDLLLYTIHYFATPTLPPLQYHRYITTITLPHYIFATTLQSLY